MILEEMINDPEVFFALEERGGHSGKNGRTDTGAGDRAVAEKTRISGLDQLRPLLAHLPDALRAGGWKDGTELTATVGPDTHDEAPGRDFSLKGAVAQAIVRAPADSPDAKAAEQSFHDEDTPEEAVFFQQEAERHPDGNRWIVAVIRYISDGMATDGATELAAELRAVGVTVTVGG